MVRTPPRRDDDWAAELLRAEYGAEAGERLVANGGAEARIGGAVQVIGEVTDVNLLLGRHAGPWAVHPGPQAEGLFGIALPILDEGHELAGEGQVLLLRVEQRAPEGSLGGPVRRDRQRERHVTLPTRRAETGWPGRSPPFPIGRSGPAT